MSPPDEEEASDIPVAGRHNAALMEDEETPPGSPVTVSTNSPSDSNVVVVTVVGPGEEEQEAQHGEADIP